MILLIAIPKSASTSLSMDLAKILSGEYKAFQYGFREIETPPVSGYSYLHKLHCDFVELHHEYVPQLFSDNLVLRQHFPPTRNNIILLRNYKKVILYRNPMDVVKGYFRAKLLADNDTRAFHEKHKDFEGIWNEDEFVEKAKEIGLAEDVNKWYTGWKQSKFDKLEITYDDAINDTTNTINKIFEYYDIDIEVENYELSKYRYTR